SFRRIQRRIGVGDGWKIKFEISMKPQLDHKVTDSFVEWVDHTMLKQAEAYQTYTTPLYPMQNDVFAGMDTYSAPYHQWVFDQSITGATIPTASGLGVPHLDYRYGRTIGGAPTGDVTYSVKDFNIYL